MTTIAPASLAPVHNAARLAVALLIPSLMYALTGNVSSVTVVALIAMSAALSLLWLDRSPWGHDKVNTAAWSLAVMALLLPSGFAFAQMDTTNAVETIIYGAAILGLIAATQAVCTHMIVLGHHGFLLIQAALTLALLVPLFVLL